jgi:tetrahydromethanopterin S-methyltransferase subunit F
MTGDTTPDLSVVEMAQRPTMSSVKFEMNSVRVRYSFFTRKKD